MQTFLPYPDFSKSASVLDRLRLGRQRVEVLQILRTLVGESDGWRNHPAVKMWRGYGFALLRYGRAVCDEWVSRGYRDTCLDKMEGLCIRHPVRLTPPPWLGDDAFHASHRSNLLRKDPGHYGQFGWSESDDLPYVWPVREGE